MRILQKLRVLHGFYTGFFEMPITLRELNRYLKKRNTQPLIIWVKAYVFKLRHMRNDTLAFDIKSINTYNTRF